MALTDPKIRQAKSKDKAYKIADKNGLYLEVRPNGARYWRHKYRFDGKEKRISHGVYPEVSLADARAATIEAESSASHARCCASSGWIYPMT